MTLPRGGPVSCMSSQIDAARSLGYIQARRQFPRVVAKKWACPARMKMVLPRWHANAHRRTGPHVGSVCFVTAERAVVDERFR